MIFCYCKSPLAKNLFLLNQNMQPNYVCLGVQLSRSVSFFGEILALCNKKNPVPRIFWENIYAKVATFLRKNI